ncbi:MAG: hypothetical protein IT159_14645 [Bryobacterales bacterium]|nr:hypothetical protein [Bryobacterales bacterium]
MTRLGEAAVRYHRLLESATNGNLDWAAELHQRMAAARLMDGARLVCPFLRPHFLTPRQYAALVRAAETLYSAVNRIEKMALENPALLARLHLLPAEKMLAAVDPGYPHLAVTSLLDTQMSGTAMRFVGYSAGTPPGVVYGAALAELFYDGPVMKRFRRQYNVSRLPGTKPLAASLVAAYKQFGGRQKPQVGVMDFRQAFQTTEPADCLLLRDQLAGNGLDAYVVYPDQLEYKAGVLRHSGQPLNLILHRMRVHEFLLRFDLGHPLVRAYRDHAVCLVNSFRSELAHKRALFALLSDESVTASFPAAERKAIQQHIPWTRVVGPVKTKYGSKTVDLPEFILRNREKLVLKPNDDSGEEHAVQGWLTGDAGWERSLRQASRTPHVVQERVEPEKAVFPVYRYGVMEMRELQVDVHPHIYLGKVQGCSSWVSEAAVGGFSSVSGLAPTYLLETKS